MYLVVVMMCSLELATDCVKLTDMRGLKLSRPDCIGRAQEIVSDLRSEFELEHVEYFFKCEQDPGLPT